MEFGGAGHQIACRPTMVCKATVPLCHCSGVLSRFLEELIAWKHLQEITSDLRIQASNNGRIPKLLLDKTLEALCGSKGWMGLPWILDKCGCPAQVCTPVCVPSPQIPSFRGSSRHLYQHYRCWWESRGLKPGDSHRHLRRYKCRRSAPQRDMRAVFPPAPRLGTGPESAHIVRR